MTETIGIHTDNSFDPRKRTVYSPGTVGAVAYLAGRLGVSRQHVYRLLKAGRVFGAWQTPAGIWALPVEVISGRRAPRIKPGKRGPRSFMAAQRMARKAWLGRTGTEGRPS